MLQSKTFQLKADAPHRFPTSPELAPKWYIVDAKDYNLGRLSSLLAKIIMGKHKPTYTKHMDSGDFVVVLNADKIALTGKKFEEKLYRRHTGYVGGLKTETPKILFNRRPEEPLKQAVWGMTTKSALARHQMDKLKLYVGEKHPHSAQNPQPLPAHIVRRSVITAAAKKQAAK